MQKNNYLLQRYIFSSLILALVLTLNYSAFAQKKGAVKTQTARVVIGQYGYDPASIRLKKGVPARITFLRTTDNTCATEVLFADYGINRALPLNQSVVVAFTPRKAGEFAFTCGMNMHRGKLVVY